MNPRVRTACRPASARLGAALRRGSVGLAAALIILALPAAAGSRSAEQARIEQAQAVQAQTEQVQLELTRIGLLGGAARAIAVQGTLAYAGIGPRLAVVDAADPALPRVLGQTAALGGAVRDIAMDGGTAYVAHERGLALIDVADPAQPELIATWFPGIEEAGGRSSGDAVTAVALYRSLAVLLTAGAIFVLDVTNPYELGQVFAMDLPSTPTDVAVARGYAFVVMENIDAGAGSLFAINIANRDGLGLVGSLGTPIAWFKSIATDGSFAYVGTDEGGLIVYDISRPDEMREVGLAKFAGESIGIALAGDYAYVAVNRYDDVGDDALKIVDVRDPAHPTNTGYLWTKGTPHSVAVAGGRAYLADGGEGLRLIDTSDPARPRELGQIDGSDYAEHIVIDGRYGYAADRRSFFSGDRLAVLDLADPRSPRELGSVDLRRLEEHRGVSAVALAAANGYAYVQTENLLDGGEVSLQVIDARDPERPAIVAVLPGPYISDMVALGSYLYTVGFKGLAVWDLRDPVRPRELASLSTVAGGAITLDGSRAYVVGDALTIVDVEKPGAPRVLGSVELERVDPLMPQAGLDVSVDRGHALVAGDQGQYIFNIVTAAQPQLLWSNYAAGVRHVYLMQNLALLAGQDGLKALEWTTPGSPDIVDGGISLGNITAVGGDGRQVYALAEGAGLQVLGLTAVAPEPQPAPETHALPAADLQVPRTGHTATLLDDGRVLVVGGSSEPGPGASTTAEIYDPATETWRLASAPKHPHGAAYSEMGHMAVKLRDGRVLIVGSGDQPELFDPRSETWRDTGQPGHYGASATLLRDGRVLVAGGGANAESDVDGLCLLFDPATDAWSPTGALSQPRAYHSATRLADGRVLVVGYDNAELFDPAAGTWRPAAAPPPASAGRAALRLADGSVMLIIPGYASSLYDPATNRWRRVIGPRTARPPGRWTATQLPDGTVWVLGGEDKQGRVLATGERFYPSEGFWQPAGRLAAGRGGHAATLLADGRVLVSGGRGDGDASLASAELFDPRGWPGLKRLFLPLVERFLAPAW